MRRLFEAYDGDRNDIEALSRYIDRKLPLANARRHGTTHERPIDRFLHEEKSTLKPLPVLPYEIEQYHEATVRAVHRGYRVYCSSVKRLSSQIALARARNSLDVLFKRILSARLWILDDWGVVSMKSEISEEVFDLLDRRKHSAALALRAQVSLSVNRSINFNASLLNALFVKREIIRKRLPSYYRWIARVYGGF